MPRFAYTARDRAGKSVVADLDAPSRKDALRILAARGLQVASVNELATAPDKSGKGGKVKAAAVSRAARRAAEQPPRRSECLPFLEALYDLLTSGLSAGEAVRCAGSATRTLIFSENSGGLCGIWSLSANRSCSVCSPGVRSMVAWVWPAPKCRCWKSFGIG